MEDLSSERSELEENLRLYMLQARRQIEVAVGSFEQTKKLRKNQSYAGSFGQAKQVRKTSNLCRIFRAKRARIKTEVM